MLTWKQHFAKPIGAEVILQPSFGAEYPEDRFVKILYFGIVLTERRYKQFRPEFAIGKEYILSINNKDVFAGSLEECQEEAERRVNDLIHKFKGKFNPELVKPVE